MKRQTLAQRRSRSASVSARGSRDGRALPPPVDERGIGAGAGFHCCVLAHRPQSGRAEREEETRFQPLLLLRPLGRWRRRAAAAPPALCPAVAGAVAAPSAPGVPGAAAA